MTGCLVPCAAIIRTGNVVAFDDCPPIAEMAVYLLDPGHDGPHTDATLDHYAWDAAPSAPVEG
ncbi:hypothetical protein [Oerskovia enterophila]|uniref:hypothetical protein n=1 Tax=Oerskovia enterophila TaxID=43678 RepID=UPI00339A61C2